MRSNTAVFFLAALLAALHPGRGGEEKVLTREEMEDHLKLQEALIKLQEAREEREKYQREYDVNLEFYKAGIVTLKELNESERRLESAKLRYKRAEIELQKTRLGFLTDVTRIEIAAAKKYLTEDGDRKVSVTLRNASDVRKALAADPSLKEEEVKNLLCIKRLSVALTAGAIISDPYEYIVDSLAVGETRTVDFHLLKDVQEVTIELRYGSAVERKSVFLRKESLREIPTMETSQGSQQGELGSVITYQIELERLSEEEKRFNLVTLGLPRHFTAHFKYNRATVSNIKFTPKITRIEVSLEVAIPEKLDKDLVGRPVEFFVVVTLPSEARRISMLNARAAAEGRAIGKAELDKVKCNYLQLDFTPLGKGKLELEIENRYKEVTVGEGADFRIYVRNTGTLEVTNITLDISPPFEWSVTAAPRFIEALAPDAKQAVVVNARPGSGSEIGEYDIRLKAVGEAGYEEVESEEKDFTIKLVPRARLMQNLVLVGVLVAVVLIISVVSIIVSRR